MSLAWRLRTSPSRRVSEKANKQIALSRSLLVPGDVGSRRRFRSRERGIRGARLTGSCCGVTRSAASRARVRRASSKDVSGGWPSLMANVRTADVYDRIVEAFRDPVVVKSRTNFSSLTPVTGKEVTVKYHLIGVAYELAVDVLIDRRN
ncbi:hypothetical protein Pmar_PMAR010496 [Perkinsus marinus ATCC 50983]|uniref:Uncharacterized protein n=1 Tax=Perkinsus marinus (strain ATCC 50983 / TXsc) TaxID=423536 RepID=C5KQ44_PERM5|nr:hypothetical protein Pmar_PMAR010496 [Perkinsus marinus ATCC 50983]EER13399.1 hypothetical protein Pmar_PMAR010496 [Perkinsus marinus ATCC 50983]|eukprot:XP_002781604.1 hypothetical protein Pmar_PMAR010496 [Perkinsus marinus ATCC 50983]